MSRACSWNEHSESSALSDQLFRVPVCRSFTYRLCSQDLLFRLSMCSYVSIVCVFLTFSNSFLKIRFRWLISWKQVRDHVTNKETFWEWKLSSRLLSWATFRFFYSVWTQLLIIFLFYDFLDFYIQESSRRYSLAHALIYPVASTINLLPNWLKWALLLETLDEMFSKFFRLSFLDAGLHLLCVYSFSTRLSCAIILTWLLLVCSFLFVSFSYIFFPSFSKPIACLQECGRYRICSRLISLLLLPTRASVFIPPFSVIIRFLNLISK